MIKEIKNANPKVKAIQISHTPIPIKQKNKSE